MNILSCFDGISCGQLALNRAGISYDKYFASEIDHKAISVTQKHFPNTIQLGDINDWKKWDLPTIDLLLAGSPCQAFSVCGKQSNFNDPRGQLFFTFADILKTVKPKYFLLENVKMKKEYLDIISDTLGVQPVLINSSLLSGQRRARYYWSNIPISIPEDKNISLQSVLESGFALQNKSYRLMASDNPSNRNSYKRRYLNRHIGNCKSLNGNNSLEDLVVLTPLEHERLQTLPDNYTSILSLMQRYKAIGNGWTVDVIAHILKGIK